MRAGPLVLAVVLAGCSVPEPGVPSIPAGPPVGLDVVRSLTFPPLRFEPPEPTRFELSNGVPVFYMHDPGLPLVDVFIGIRGGHHFFGREHFAAATALLPLMRHGGTERLPPDSLEAEIAFNALGLSTSMNGARMEIGVSTLRDRLDAGLDLWSDMLLRPRFDEAAVERWRIRELEAARRLPDLPGSLAVIEFNRLVYGDHPTGWRMTPDDLAPERVTRERIRSLHEHLICPEHAVIGASGDVSAEQMRASLERTLRDWEPCGTTLADPAPPTLRTDRRTYVIHRPISQSTVVVGQPGGVRLEESSDYFASRIANWVIGGGGFSSRLMTRLRTEEGLAYSAASIWGVARSHERILGGITHTRGESTVQAARLLLETFDRARSDPPDSADIALARASILNGFVFGFSRPAQVVARQVSYLAAGLPADWLTRYADGIAAVDEAAVADVLRRTIDPGSFTILIVGDTTRFDPSELGPVRYLPAPP